jgi:glycosyltransferase involved in cell wall biosynthesis
MTKTILIVTDNLKDQINGVVTTFKSIETLASSNGYNIVYLDPGEFSYIDCPGYPEVKLSFPRQVGKKIKAHKPDYIHIATEGPIGLSARIWCDKNGYRYNTSYHTKFPEFIKKIYGIPECMTYWYVRWFHKHSGKVLTTTETMRKELIEHGFKNNIISWTRGVDREKLKADIVNSGRYVGLKPNLLYVGRVSKEKGLDELCKLQHFYKIKIVGDGPYRKELQKKFTQVEFAGYQSGTKLANSYQMADVFVFPSRNDTFGIVIIEALSQGCPVAAYHVPGPMDILEQGVTGYMSDSLAGSINLCLTLDRDVIKEKSQYWTWERCWQIFQDNLISVV